MGTRSPGPNCQFLEGSNRKVRSPNMTKEIVDYLSRTGKGKPEPRILREGRGMSLGRVRDSESNSMKKNFRKNRGCREFRGG